MATLGEYEKEATGVWSLLTNATIPPSTSSAETASITVTASNLLKRTFIICLSPSALCILGEKSYKPFGTNFYMIGFSVSNDKQDRRNMDNTHSDIVDIDYMFAASLLLLKLCARANCCRTVFRLYAVACFHD
jgi:hypothetical protein